MNTATVILLSYNSPDLFGAIDSVIAQTYEDIQFIIADDCSEDFDCNYVKSYVNKKNTGNIKELIVMKNESNLGTVKNLNSALAVSRGDCIFNLAGDDCFYDEDVILDCVREFENTNALIITGRRSVYDNEMKVHISDEPSDKIIKKIKFLSPKELLNDMSGYNYIFGCCTVRSRKCIEKYGFFDEKYKYIEDYSMNMKLLRNDVKFHFYDRIIVKYRRGGISNCLNLDKNYFSESDLIFADEIEPYVESTAKARKKYDSWKRQVIIDSKYSSAVMKAGNNKLLVFGIRFFYYITQPRLVLKKFFQL